jgi:hypothetical protein
MLAVVTPALLPALEVTARRADPCQLGSLVPWIQLCSGSGVGGIAARYRDLGLPKCVARDECHLDLDRNTFSIALPGSFLGSSLLLFLRALLKLLCAYGRGQRALGWPSLPPSRLPSLINAAEELSKAQPPSSLAPCPN